MVLLQLPLSAYEYVMYKKRGETISHPSELSQYSTIFCHQYTQEIMSIVLPVYSTAHWKWIGDAYFLAKGKLGEILTRNVTVLHDRQNVNFLLGF